MFKSDSLYQVLLKYNFDLFRGNKGIKDYMSEHLNQYWGDISTAVKGENSFLGEKVVGLIKEKLDFLKEICEEIPEILNLYDQGLLKETYRRSDELFEKVKPYFLTRFSWRESSGSFYRIRQGDFRIKEAACSKKQKMALFQKIQECVDAESSYNRGCCVDIDKIKEQFEQFHNLMRKILHKHTVFSFGFENLENYEKI